jgi:hypothetical protein
MYYDIGHYGQKLNLLWLICISRKQLRTQVRTTGEIQNSYYSIIDYSIFQGFLETKVGRNS